MERWRSRGAGSDRRVTNTHNDGAAHLARFLDYAAAESTGGAGGEGVLRSSRAGDDAVDPTTGDACSAAIEIADQLRVRGLDAVVRVGRSAFTIDVAVRRDGEYVLGIIVDPGQDAATTTACMIAEDGVLAAMTWPITRVLITV